VKYIWIIWIGIAVFPAACASTAGPQSEQRAAVSLVTAPAELTDLPSPVEAGGIVGARVTAVIASRVMASIVEVRVAAGDRVRRGDVLVMLDTRDLRAADLRAQASTLSAAESVRAADAEVRATESALQLARLTHDRIAALQTKRSATAAELDQAIAARSAAEAQHAAAQARLAAATAGRDAAQATADAAAVTTTYGTLTAPFDGVITDRTAEPGSMAAPGAPLLTLEDPSTYRLEVRLDETRAALVTRGGEAAIHFDDRDTSFNGQIIEIARVNPASHSFLVKIDLPAGLEVRSGQFGRASFSGPRRRTVTVPSSALLRRGQLTFVFVADADRRVHLRPVSTGAAAGGRTEVLAGLVEGDRVVTSPPPTLGDGDAVAGARP
jgi:multidrug efflux pump subunit AcrA (membrane-fusion protein)